MNIDEFNFSNYTYKEISQYIKSLDISKDYVELIMIAKNIKNDKRKSVKSLGEKIIKSIEKYNEEIIRVKDMYDFDKSYGDYKYIAGVDEVGRGPLAGPIVAAAVILDLNSDNNKNLILGLNDSKKISLKNREKISKSIINNAIDFNISVLSNELIDKKGIAWCNNEVLKLASTKLKVKPNLILSDAFKIKNCNIKNEFVIKGDTKSASIAAASIVAKVYRDNIMKEYSNKYPMYSFNKNVGYGTKEHINAIKKFGITNIHRKSFLKNIV